MPKPNYKFEKRKRDIAKKQKKDAKRESKLRKGKTDDVTTDSSEEAIEIHSTEPNDPS